MMFLRIVTAICICFAVSSCGPISTPKAPGQNETKLLVETALYDFPIASSSVIVPERSVILGSGSGWSGRVTLVDKMSPGEMLSYMNGAISDSGWSLSSSAISEQIVLVYEKEDRVATVQISTAEKALFSFISGIQTKVEIFVNAKENSSFKLPSLSD